jgi:hypothetical protein
MNRVKLLKSIAGPTLGKWIGFPDPPQKHGTLPVKVELRVWLAECHLATLAFRILVPVVRYLNNSKREAGTRTRRIRFICLVMEALLARNS